MKLSNFFVLSLVIGVAVAAPMPEANSNIVKRTPNEIQARASTHEVHKRQEDPEDCETEGEEDCDTDGDGDCDTEDEEDCETDPDCESDPEDCEEAPVDGPPGEAPPGETTAAPPGGEAPPPAQPGEEKPAGTNDPNYPDGSGNSSNAKMLTTSCIALLLVLVTSLT